MLRVGAATEVELKEKKHRLEDAISATRAAIEEGIVPGGGSALVQLAAGLGDLGLKPATRRPAWTWCAARCPPRAAGSRRTPAPRAAWSWPPWPRPSPATGFNAATGEYGDLVAQGVIDPVKVTRSAVLNAASIAAMLLTTEVLVADKPEPSEPAAAGGGHGHGH